MSSNADVGATLSTNNEDDSLPSQSKSVQFCFLDDQQEGRDEAEKTALMNTETTSDDNRVDTSAEIKSSSCQATKGESNENLDDKITFLIEIAGITLPPDKSSSNRWMMDLGDAALNPRGMHCTACWVDKIPQKGGTARKETVLHRTKTMRVDGSKVADADVTISASESSDGTTSTYDSSVEDEGKNSEHILTVNDSSLFLFETSLKQLLEAQTSRIKSKESASTEINNLNQTECGGIRFDVYEKPIDALSSIYRTVLAESTREKEDKADDATFSYSSKKLTLASYNASYRLVGSIFMTPEEIFSRCDSERFESDLYNGLKNKQRSWNDKSTNEFERKPVRYVGNGGKLALRIRKASEFDSVFIQTLRHCDMNNVPLTVEMLNNAVRQNDPTKQPLKPVTITTECDEKEVAAQASLKAIGNFSPVAMESVRYLFSDEIEPRVFVKPYADPNRMEETQWFTEEQLHRECWKESTNWIKAGSGTLGKVFVEVLQCRDLPNVDTGPGNKTDAFVSIVYGDVMVQTETIDDSLAPMWMPWTKRAYVFNMDHPSTAMYIGVVDYDVGPAEHECIGRVAIQINKFSPGMIYTLSYNLYESSTLTERGDSAGVITLRLRVEYNEKKYLQKGWITPSSQYVNSQQWKSHRVCKFCCDGPHDDEVFEMSVFRSHINEIMTAKRTITYVISDALNSIVFWRAQVKVGNAWLPLHSAVVFYFSICLVERPQFLPSYLCFMCGWILMANMFQRENHPNPWKRGHSFWYYWNILISGRSLYTPKTIEPLEGHKDAVKYDKIWQNRLEEDDARWAKQAELDAKVKDISDESIIRTKAKANAPLTDPISSLAGARLLPYQQRLGGYCKKIRYARNVLNWSESAMSFRLTLICFGGGAVALMIPWAFILKWAARIIVWTFLGPWMKAVDIYYHGLTLEEELKRSKEKSADELNNAFKMQCHAAKILRETTLKLKGEICCTKLDYFSTHHIASLFISSSLCFYQHSELNCSESSLPNCLIMN